MRLSRLLPLAAAALAAGYVRKVYRLRDPVRVVEGGPDQVLSPADGLISFVRQVREGQVMAGQGVAGSQGVAGPERNHPGAGPLRLCDLLDTPAHDGWLMGIFVGPLDVQYAYQPVGGLVTAVSQQGSRANHPLLGVGGVLASLAGQPTELLHTRAALENERLSVTTRSSLGDITVALIGRGDGQHLTPYLRGGGEAHAGHKLAFLPGGGLALLHLPEALVPQVGVGDRVVGTQTVIARG